MPAGLVGIFGPNGAGKSTLLEAITWTLWGQVAHGQGRDPHAPGSTPTA